MRTEKPKNMGWLSVNRAIVVGSIIALSMAAPASGNLPAKETLTTRAGELGTDNHSSRRARQVLSGKAKSPFPYPTIVVGIEKAPRERIRDDVGSYRSKRELDILDRLKAQAERLCGVASPTSLESRNCTLAHDQVKKAKNYFDSGKRAFASHIISWQKRSGKDLDLPYDDPEVVYNAYVDCARDRSGSVESVCEKKSAYENGWSALELLGERVAHILASDSDFTHLLLISQGWNTTQGSSLERASKMTRLIGDHAEPHHFRPLVIVVTWHSGWSWLLADIPIVNFLPRIASYVNKARDADEIGLTWANELLNRYLLPTAHEAEVPVIVIGHSFGARMLTRAAASGHLIDPPADGAGISLLIALQGAFSVNRFLPERCAVKEGAPYSELTSRVSKVVLTWSRWDWANPVAQLASQANHAGGYPAFRRARAYESRFELKKWGASGLRRQKLKSRSQGERCPCDFPLPKTPPVELVDATSIVKGHGDIDDDDMAELLWDLIREAR